jgi:hypothetical protein
MKTRQFRLLVKSIFAIGLAWGNAYAGDTSLCEKSEEVVFSCDFPNKKSVAICTDRESNYLEYRFGKPANVELRHRADGSSPTKKFHRAEVLYASNSVRVIWFSERDVYYKINLPMRGGPSLEVSRNGETLKQLFCKGGWGGSHGEPSLQSGFIVEHGSADISKIAPLWGER